ncbi:sugar phosphate isomerase/epimerase [Alkalihalobacillus sp. MEB130]|uniref:sugar phosphate isomerase/epimerase family protein n=1 Tax=Alkalihalobacillus sp. MEB130 TaxID=2976704 RepID=UPI0028DF1485|nr:sugar phosphate isomerase/epimerase [Alkalihalobacillus sp. MEB130]MDT8859795.1 sugar phosphate isomerase/epimerase [Alkalihalobacillus sp. MEB130]
MSIGVLAHLVGKRPYHELAEKVASYGFDHVQLALWKAISDYDLSKVGTLSPGLVKDIYYEFQKRGVSISVLACYLHLFDRDVEKRKENVARFKELIKYASLFHTPIVACEVGKVQDGMGTDEDWKLLKASLLELIEEAEKWGVIIGVEPANEHLIGTARQLKYVIDEIPSSHLGVVLDPGNLLTAENFHEQDKIIKEAFQLLGDRIVASHAKDRIIDENGEIKTVRPGKGELNYPLYFKLLHDYKPHCEVILEATKPDEMVETKELLEAIRMRALSVK